MRIHILSDIHLEFSEFQLPSVDADVRVIAGDLHTKNRGIPFLLSDHQKLRVIYVAGNHEFYGTAIPKLYSELRGMTSGTQVSFLENDEIVIGNTRFLGCTLWTDFGLLNSEYRELAMNEAKLTMNDYRKIRHDPSYRKLTPGLTYKFHRSSLNWLDSRLRIPFDGKTVVVSHHAPSPRSVADPNELISAAYCSDLEQFISEHSFDLWIHGHTHRSVDFQIGRSRIVSNPRAYPGENPEFDPSLVVTI